MGLRLLTEAPLTGRCETCVWWRAQYGSHGGSPYYAPEMGTCEISPPDSGGQPTTRRDSRCGQWSDG